MPELTSLTQLAIPGEWPIAQFEPFDGLTPYQEFDLVAPIHLYFSEDMTYEKHARDAAVKLKALAHPLMAGRDVDDLIAGSDSLPHCENRYNQLLMVIANSARPGIHGYVNEHGGFAFVHEGQGSILESYQSGTFAIILNATAVRRLLDAVPS